MLVLFLAAPIMVPAQDANQKKIERLQRKIEKQTKKLQELTGDEAGFAISAVPPIRAEEIEKIREEAMAQADEAREHAREAMEQQREIMEQQREAMKEQKKAMEEKMIVIRKKNLEKMGELRELNEDSAEGEEGDVEIIGDNNGKKFHYYYKTPKLNYRYELPEGAFNKDFKVEIPEFRGNMMNWYSPDQDNLNINKELADETNSADFNYELKKGANGMTIRVEGSIDSGKVKISIKKPDGELYNEYTLSPLANVNWKQSVSFDEEDAAKYLGKWTVSVSAEKAKGKYSVQLNGR